MKQRALFSNTVSVRRSNSSHYHLTSLYFLFNQLAHRKSKFPVENDDFNNITRIGNFGNAVIAHTCEDLQYWFVKKVCSIINK